MVDLYTGHTPINHQLWLNYLLIIHLPVAGICLNYALVIHLLMIAIYNNHALCTNKRAKAIHEPYTKN